MEIITTNGWDDYVLLDSGNGKRLERFGTYIVDRPDPQCIWLPKLSSVEWERADAVFEKKDGKEKWIVKKNLPEKWLVHYKDISLYAKLSPFKHTGIFPEQSVQWDLLHKKIKSANRPIKLLNLFAYTGAASLIAASAGAQVTHVDASSAAIGWARENQEASKLTDKPIRWILDDVMKFIEREVRRGNTYDAILMDPPIYGHGAHHEVWDFMKDFPSLIETCVKLLSDTPLFLVINAYAISASAILLENVLRDHVQHGTCTIGELVLREESGRRLLSTGIFLQWSL